MQAPPWSTRAPRRSSRLPRAVARRHRRLERTSPPPRSRARSRSGAGPSVRAPTGSRRPMAFRSRCASTWTPTAACAARASRLLPRRGRRSAAACSAWRAALTSARCPGPSASAFPSWCAAAASEGAGRSPGRSTAAGAAYEVVHTLRAGGDAHREAAAVGRGRARDTGARSRCGRRRRSRCIGRRTMRSSASRTRRRGAGRSGTRRGGRRSFLALRRVLPKPGQASCLSDCGQRRQVR